MTINERLNSLSETRTKINELKNELVQQSYDIFTDLQKEIFTKYPELESFGWSQYTPYFNDGDTCIFSANTDYIKMNDEYAEDSNWFNKNNVIDWGKWNNSTRGYEGRVEEPNNLYNKKLANAHDEIVNFLSYFDDDFYLSKFGDHAEIIITKDSLTIEDLDHD